MDGCPGSVTAGNQWHQINVIAVEEAVPRGRYPKAIKRVGESPPQYIDEEEEDEG
ncbi:hypothetical protein [Candidatus Manganitrophus noduliformans]|uniref:hypothetical protein n=1 Tax=Candidatus Manganitrophus noduliformans TaxID=2606439 RepID=UPI00143B74A6|nr:hypothetical protein [Candidatus Manganitrophus noduliformans]